MSAYDKADNDEEFQMIHQHCKDAWSAVAPPHVRLEADGFAQVLKSCLGAIPEPDIVSGIMKRASAYETRHNSSLYLNDESSGQPYITMRAFSNYLVSFRGLTLKDDARRRGPGDSTDTDTGDSSSSGSEDSVDEERCGICPGLLRDKSKPLLADGLRRTQPGFCGHLNCTVQTSLISFWRTMGIKMLFLVVMIFAAGFLGVMDVVVFKTPRWSPTGFLNVQIALALLVSVYSLQLFSLDQEMYWREASHGLNRASFFLGRTLVQTLDWALLTFVYVSMYYCIAAPQLLFTLYIWPFVLVSYVASGWGFAISCCLPVELGAFISSILAFMMGGILGLPMQMQTFLNGGFMEVMVDCISFTRWSVSMSFLEYLALHPPDEAKLDTINGELLKLFRDHAYTKATFILDVRDGQWWTGVLALLLQGSVLRVVAYLGLRFTNRARQI